MLVKTNAVKENSNSIGMFSRYGKVTTIIHSIFREKKELVKPKKAIESDLFSRFVAQENDQTHERMNTTHERATGSFYFRSVSRDRAQRPRARTPDVGRYRPKYDLVEPKVVNYTSTRERENYASGSDHRPNCVKDGSGCDFKARQLKKKIIELRREINNSGADVEALYKNNVINRAVLKLFKSPSIKLLKNEVDDKDDQSSSDNLAALQDYDGNYQKSNAVVSQIIAYHNMKEEYKAMIHKNKENLEKCEERIPDRPRATTPIPLQFDYQLPRPPIVKPPKYQGGSSALDLSSTHLETNTTFANDRLRNTRGFENYTKRRTLFPGNDISLIFYEYDKFKTTKPNNIKAVPQFGKMKARPGSQQPKESAVDYTDLLKSFQTVARKTDFSFDIRRKSARKFTFPKQSQVEIRGRDREYSPPSFSSANKTFHDLSFTKNNASFL